MTTTAEYNKNIAGPITGCPVCGSAVYDNTAPGAKKNPKGPDYKCKANGDHAFWIKRGAAPKQSYDAGAVMPWETPAEAAQIATLSPVAHVAAPVVDRVAALFALHDRCLAHAVKQSEVVGMDDAGAIS